MRWLSFERNGQASFGRVVDDGVVDAGTRTGIPTLKAAIGRGLEGVAAAAGDSADFLPPKRSPISRPSPIPDKILCVGLNYRDHQEETGRGGEDNPTIFVRFAAAQVGHLGKMLRPSESATLDFEGEIALIIGKPGRRIAPADWLDHIAGFSCYNDGSVREYQRHNEPVHAGARTSPPPVALARGW